MSEQQNNSPTDNPVINEAANVFMQGLPRVKALASNMKGGALGRVFKAVVEFPLGEGYPKFRSKAENELFITTMSLIQAKNVMVNGVLAEQKLKEQAEEAAAQESMNLKTIAEAEAEVKQMEEKKNGE